MLEPLWEGPLWQWDFGRKLDATGVAEGTTVTFQCPGDSQALAVKPVDGQVEVPTQLIVMGRDIVAIAVNADGGICSRKFQVIERSKPSNVFITPTEIETIESLKQWVLDAVKAVEGMEPITDEYINSLFA